MAYLFQDLIKQAALRYPDQEALVYGEKRLSYLALCEAVTQAAEYLVMAGLKRGERVAVYLEKRVETVVAMFAAAAAGGVFVPINPLLKADQVAFILNDCGARVLVTSAERLLLLDDVIANCQTVQTGIIVGLQAKARSALAHDVEWIDWDRALNSAVKVDLHRIIDSDMAAILYTSGSTGKPKGVVLSHRNLVVGASSVASYLENKSDDRILAVLPLSFDYGLSQLTTAFHVGATVVLINHLLPRDVMRMVEAERITGLAAVPPLWVQLATLNWPQNSSLRYLTNSGGVLARSTLHALRACLQQTKIYLMYGLTEAFRSTYLSPAELDTRPDSIGKAIPNAEVLVLRPDGSSCAPNEPGELVHRGALVSLGYWNRPQKTEERFKPLPSQHNALPIPEIAVWSGDIVRADEAGYLYFVGRSDDMIKTSGYRVSPSEVEEVLYQNERVAEAAALGIPDPDLGQGIVVIVSFKSAEAVEALPINANMPDASNEASVLQTCRIKLPSYMLPSRVITWDGALPRNPNGKIDRQLLAQWFSKVFLETKV